MRWLSIYLIRCLYPGAPFARMCTALETYSVVVEMWLEEDTVEAEAVWGLR